MKTKRVLAVLMVVMLVLGLFATTAMATGYPSPQKTISTSVTNGTITESQTIRPWEAVTISYSPNEGCYLKSVTVNGWLDATSSNPDSYKFYYLGFNQSINVEYAYYEYDVTFEKGEHGTFDEQDSPLKQKVTYGQNATPPTVKADEGYKFTGWSGSCENVKENRTLVAQYEQLCKVTFKKGAFGTFDESGAPSVQWVESGSSATAPTVKPFKGYEHIGWNGSYEDVTQDVTLTAQYKKKSYTVEFLPGDHGGFSYFGAPAKQTVIHGFGAFAPTVVPHMGYVFTEWDAAFNKVTSNLVITALYEPIMVPVIFQAGENGAFDPDGASGEQSVIFGRSATAPTVIPSEGYVFVGWDKPFFFITKPTTVTALYCPIYYRVTFKEGTSGSFDISGASSIQWIRHGLGATAPTVIPNEGYDFTSWSGSFDNVTSHLTITAQYALKTYSVEFLPGTNGSFDAAGAAALQTVEHGGSAAAPTVKPAEGYSFTGWSCAFDNIKQNTTVTAQYQKNSYTVTFECNGGSAVAAITALYDTNINKPADPTRAHYSFAGWYKDAQLSVPWDFATDKVGSADITLYAKWSANAISNIPLKHTMYVGGRVTWSPQPSNGAWTFDAAYLSSNAKGSPATFTALKKGVTLVTYSANGVNYQIEVTILEALMPVTGQQSTWIWIFGGLGICLAGSAVLLMLRKRRHGTCNE